MMFKDSSRAQLHLRQILDAPGVNATVMPGSEFLLGRAHQAFDANGDLINEQALIYRSLFYRFLRFNLLPNQLNLPEEIRFEPGTYHVSTEGHNGKLPMDVTVSEDRIEKIEIPFLWKSSGIADVVFTRIPAEIIEANLKC